MTTKRGIACHIPRFPTVQRCNTLIVSVSSSIFKHGPTDWKNLKLVHITQPALRVDRGWPVPLSGIFRLSIFFLISQLYPLTLFFFCIGTSIFLIWSLNKLKKKVYLSWFHTVHHTIHLSNPLGQHLKLGGTTRASFQISNSKKPYFDSLWVSEYCFTIIY